MRAGREGFLYTDLRDGGVCCRTFMHASHLQRTTRGDNAGWLITMLCRVRRAARVLNATLRQLQHALARNTAGLLVGFFTHTSGRYVGALYRSAGTRGHAIL